MLLSRRLFSWAIAQFLKGRDVKELERVAWTEFVHGRLDGIGLIGERIAGMRTMHRTEQDNFFADNHRSVAIVISQGESGCFDALAAIVERTMVARRSAMGIRFMSRDSTSSFFQPQP